MECVLILAAESMLVDYETKVVSAINILDDFKTITTPFAMKLAILTSIRKEAGDDDQSEITLEITLNSHTLVAKNLSISFPPGYLNTKSITRFGALVIPSAGELSFRVIHKGDLKKHFSIQVQGIEGVNQPIIVGEKTPI